MRSLFRRLLVNCLFIFILFFGVFNSHNAASIHQITEIPKEYRAIMHLHTSFSHDAKFMSEPNLQLNNLKEKGYQVVLVSEHDYSNIGKSQTDFFIPPFRNGGFEKGSPYPNQWRPIRAPRDSATYLNVTDSKHVEGESSFHLHLKGREEDFDLLSWAYWEKGEDRTHDRSVSYNLLLEFSLYFLELSNSNSLAYVSCTLGRKDDPRYHEVSNRLIFYFSESPSEDLEFFDITNSTRQVSIRLDASLKKWRTYTVNITDYALSMFDGLEEVPTKYLFLKQVTLNLASRREGAVDVYADGFQAFSGWTPTEMYDWWRHDMESYSDDGFLVIGGLETTHEPDIGAYGLEKWHDFSGYDLVVERVNEIKKDGAVSCLVNPRASNFTAVKEGGGWGTELFEIFNTVHDSRPSPQVLKAWDEFLSSGTPIFGVAGFDSHGLKARAGSDQPSVASQPLYENIIIARGLTRDDILQSLRKGLVYIIRYDHPIRMSFSSGPDGPQQGRGTVFTSSETGVVLSINLQGAPIGSKLTIIRNGTQALEADVTEDPFNFDIRLPITEKANYFRLEIRYQEEIIAFSNPLFFSRTALPQDVWIGLDPVFSSSTTTSVQVYEGQITVLLESLEEDFAVLRIHCPSKPSRLTVNGKDYINNKMPEILDIMKNNDDWSYDQKSQMLALTVKESASIVLEFSSEMPESTNVRNLQLSIIGVIGLGSGLIIILIFYFQKASTRRGKRP